MKRIVFYLTVAFLSVFCFAKAQAQGDCVSTFGTLRDTCWSKTAGYLWLPVYSTSHPKTYLSPDAEGKIGLDTVGDGTPYTAGYGIAISNDTINVDSAEIPTQYQLDTAKINIRTEIANIPVIDTTSLSDRIIDTAAALRTSLRTNATVGTLYNKKSWSSLTDFTSGITPTLVDSNIKLAYTSSAAQNAFMINSYTQLDRWSVTANIVIDTSAFTKVGVGQYGAGQFAATGTWIEYRKATGKIYVVVGNGTTMDSSYYTVPAIAGDTLVINANYSYDNIYFRGSAYNLRSDSSTTVDFSAGEAEVRGQLNTTLSAGIGRHGIITYNGGFTIDSLNVTSRTIKNPDLAIAGHSIGWGATVTDNHYSFPFIISRYFNNVVQMSGSGNSINDLINLLPQAAIVAPKQVMLVIGYNDFFFGVSVDSIIARYDRLVAGYEALGTRVIHTTPTYSTALDVTPLRTHIMSTYPESNAIDLYPVIQSMGSAGLYDGVHPNDSGSARIADAILYSGKIAGQMVNNVPLKDHVFEDNIIQAGINRPTVITGLRVPSGDQTILSLFNPNSGSNNGSVIEFGIGNNPSARGKIRVSDNTTTNHRFMAIDLFGASALQEVARFTSYHRGLLLGGVDTNQTFTVTRPSLMAAGPIGTWSAATNDVSGISRYWGVAATHAVRMHEETSRHSSTAANNWIIRRVHNGVGGFGRTKGFTMRGDERYGFGVDSTDVTATVDIGGNLRIRTIPTVTTYDSVLVVNDGVPNKVLQKISVVETIDFANTAANEQTDVIISVAVTGAAVGDVTTIGVPDAATGQGTWFAWVSATDEVTIRFHNTGSGDFNPPVGDYKVYVWK